MRVIWEYLWSRYPLSVGGFAQFINVDRYCNKFYMKDYLLFHNSKKEVDVKLSLFLFKEFMLEYYDTLVYDIPQADVLPEGDPGIDDIIMSVGVSFPKIMLGVMEASKFQPVIGREVKNLSEGELAIGEFMEAMCLVMTNYIGLIAQDNEIYPVTYRLSEYMIRYIPDLDDGFEIEDEEISPTIH